MKWFKYLGSIIGTGRNPFNHQLVKICTKARQLSAAVLAKARKSFNQTMVGTSLWNNMACPAILFGCETTQFDEATIRKLEVAQNSIGRGILGAKSYCSTVAIRNELGWKSMRMRIYERKLRFWGKVYFQNVNRWAKQSYLSSVYEGWTSKWFNEIRKIRQELCLESMVNVRSADEWNTMVKNAVSKYERDVFEGAKREMSTLMWYNTPFNHSRKVIPYVNGSAGANCLFRLKTGSWVQKYEGNNRKVCQLCGELDGEIHRILYCDQTLAKRIEIGLVDKTEVIRERSASDVETLGNLTMGSRDECLEVGRIIHLLDTHIKTIGITMNGWVENNAMNLSSVHGCNCQLNTSNKSCIHAL